MVATKLPDLMTAKQFAEQMGIVSKTNLYKVIAQLPRNCVFRCGRRVRLLREPLQAWIESGGHSHEGAIEVA